MISHSPSLFQIPIDVSSHLICRFVYIRNTAEAMDSDTAPLHDLLLPWLWSVKQALEDFHSGKDSGSDLTKLLSDCITAFKDNAQYRDDIRFLKLWFLYMDTSEDFESVFLEMLHREICVGHSLLYVWYATFLEAKEKLYDAHMVYQMGISRSASVSRQDLACARVRLEMEVSSFVVEYNYAYDALCGGRNAKPVEWVEKAHALFLSRMYRIASSAQKIGNDGAVPFGSLINPWSSSTMKDLLKKVNRQLTKYDGYHSTTKAYSGKVALSSLKNSSRNKTIEIGRMKYQIIGCAGQGGFAQVYKAYVSCNPEDVVALKIQKPAFPWEFYMYRQLDQRISDKERSSFGFAHRMHLYPDCSILVSDYLASGTLQDAINSYAFKGKSMEEVLCIYYTIEMLYMLETLHGVGIIHGDFKPDNLLIRYARNGLTKAGSHDRTDFTEEEFRERSGPWLDQGLCLVDWGRGIDLHLFPDNVEFTGDCRTSGFRCVEMQENRPWTYQVDTYGLCVVVHTMLHNSYMEIDKKPSPEGGHFYLPKSSFKRYWNVELWRNFFKKLLNSSPGCNHKKLLQDLRESFQDYLCSEPQLIRKLSDLLVKQRASLCSA